MDPRSEPTVYFLIGAERSGTTLLRLMLDHHPRIACGGEFNYATGCLNDDGSEPAPAVFEERLKADRAFLATGLPFDPALSYRDQVQGFLRGICGPGDALGATVHFGYPELLRWWPHARFVHLVRDPRDVAPSVIQMGWSGNHWTATRRWVEAEQGVEAFRQQVGDERVFRLRFEDLVCEPVDTLTKLATFLGQEYDPAMLSYPEHTTYPAPDASAAERWRKKLSDAEVQLIEHRAGAQLEQSGYQASGLPAVQLDDSAMAALRKQDRRYRVKHRVDKYGLRLVASLWTAKRLGFQGWQDRTLSRMRQIDQARLR